MFIWLFLSFGLLSWFKNHEAFHEARLALCGLLPADYPLDLLPSLKRLLNLLGQKLHPVPLNFLILILVALFLLKIIFDLINSIQVQII